MLGVAAAAFAFGLPTFVAGQTAKATCLPGFTSLYNSDNVNPCDIAAALAGVCAATTFTLQPLDPTFVYLGPQPSTANACRCSSVYYSLLSACAYCQDRNYVRWTAYNTNCTTVYSRVFDKPIPVGLKVPAYAYQDVETSDNFNVTLAQNTKGTESTRLPSSSSSSRPSVTGAPRKSKTNVGAIAGGVVGGVVGLILLGALIFWLLTRNKKKNQKPAISKLSNTYDPVQQTPLMGYAPSATHTSPFTMSPAPTTISHPPPTMSPAPGTIYDPNDPTTFPMAEHSTGTGSYHPYPQPGTPDPLLYQNYGQHGGVPQNYTGSTQAGRPAYTGAPEV